MIDLGGLAGQVRANSQVPPARGLLSPLQERRVLNAASNIEGREPIEPVDDLFGGQTWDVFLSHVSENKESVAVPLRDALTAREISVWLDKSEMRIGNVGSRIHRLRVMQA